MQPFVPRYGVKTKAALTCLLAIVLLGATALSGSMELPTEASGAPAGEHSVAAYQGAEEGLTEGQLTPRSYLPLVLGRTKRSGKRSLMGLQVFSLNDLVVDRLTEAGPSWIRVPIHWSWIEPENTTPENYRWSAGLDDQLAELGGQNMRIILTLKDNPSWAATYPSGPIDLVAMDELVEFMVAAVEHYSAAPYSVKHWEIYNEPDNGDVWRAKNGGWGFFGNNPQAYVDILSAVYGPMKAADPEAQIVFGGIAYDNWTTTGGPFVKEFLDGVLLRGGGDFFDVMNFHYYLYFRDVWDPYGIGVTGKVQALREKLAFHGVEKPFICTETSMWSDELHKGSDELQSRYVAKVFARSMAADLKTTIWFMLSEDPGPTAVKYGLVDSDLNPKPSLAAFQTASQQIGPSDYVRALSSVETGSDQIEAYELLAEDGAMRIIVAWSNDDASYPLVLARDQVVVVGKYGGRITVSDGDDGVIDGQTVVPLGPSPQYLHLRP